MMAVSEMLLRMSRRLLPVGNTAGLAMENTTTITSRNTSVPYLPSAPRTLRVVVCIDLLTSSVVAYAATAP